MTRGDCSRQVDVNNLISYNSTFGLVNYYLLLNQKDPANTSSCQKAERADILSAERLNDDDVNLETMLQFRLLEYEYVLYIIYFAEMNIDEGTILL